MKHGLWICLIGLLFLSLNVGCNKSENALSPPTQGTVSESMQAKYLLTTEPSSVKGVIAIRKDSKDGDEITIVGRVGGSVKPVVEGRAAFTIVDLSLVPCSEMAGDTCETPWDYCCALKEELSLATIMVKFVDERGKTLQQDAKALLGIEPQKTVIVRGQAKRDDDGNMTILGDALYLKP